MNRYDAFGEPHSANVGRFGFTGQMYMENLGLHHYKARAYHSGVGRFLQTDPIGYGDGMNMYAYVHNDPVNLTDPTGTCAALAGVCAGAIIGAAVGGTMEFMRPSREYSTGLGRAGGVLRAAAVGAVAGGAAALPLANATSLAAGATAGASGGALGAAVSCYGNGEENCVDKIALSAGVGFLSGGLGGAAGALNSPTVRGMIGNIAVYAGVAGGKIIDLSKSSPRRRTSVTITDILTFDPGLYARGYYDNILYGGFSAGLNRHGGTQISSAGSAWATNIGPSWTVSIDDDVDCENGCTE